MNPYTNEPIGFGAILKPQTVSDIELGTVTPQTPIPSVFFPTYTNFIDMQSQIGCCGAGVGKALKEVFTNIEGNPTHLSMEYLWKKIKTFDGIPQQDGTAMIDIMKGLQKFGVCSNALLPTNAIGADPVLFATDNTTPSMNADALTHTISSGYAFQWSPSMVDIKTAIYNHKAVILCLNVGQEFWTNHNGQASWGVDIFPLQATYPVTSGHFVLAIGYDADNIYFLNQWSDSWGKNGIGWFGYDYIHRVNQIGTAVDVSSVALQASLSYGSRGSAVSLLQKRLGLPIDGIFGINTKNAVEDFQKSHGLVSDGIVGSKTNSVLNGATMSIMETTTVTPVKTITPGNIEVNGIKSTLKTLGFTMTGGLVTVLIATIYHFNFGGYEAIAMIILPPVFKLLEKLLLPYDIIVTDPTS
jgi:hypothetical protein